MAADGRESPFQGEHKRAGKIRYVGLSEVAAATPTRFRSVEEYRMVFSSVRDGIALEVGVWVGQRMLPATASYWVLSDG